MWKAKVAPKIKTFAMKLLKNSIPVMVNLRRRGMEVEATCPICGLVEDVEHMVYRCSWTKLVCFGSHGVGEQYHPRSTMMEWIMDRRNEG